VNDFIRLFEKSVIISGLLALMLVATGCYLWASGHTVPQELYLLLGTIVGFFFGAKQYAAGNSGGAA
jgi:hypothetical protein